MPKEGRPITIVEKRPTNHPFSVTTQQADVMIELVRRHGLGMSRRASSGDLLELKDQRLKVQEGTHIVEITNEADGREDLFWNDLETTLEERSYKHMATARTKRFHASNTAQGGLILDTIGAVSEIGWQNHALTTVAAVLSLISYWKAGSWTNDSKSHEKTALGLNPRKGSLKRMWHRIPPSPLAPEL